MKRIGIGVRHRKALYATSLLVMVLILPGCWNRRELNDLAITVALGIDKAPGGYRVSAQVVNPSEAATTSQGGGGSGRAPVSTFGDTGASISEALRRMTTISPRAIYLAHLQMLVIDEALAREGISELLDFLSRNHEVRTDFYVVIAKGTKAHDILNVQSIIEKIPANKMNKSLKTSEENWAPTHGVTLDVLVSDLLREGANPVLTGISIIGDKQTGSKQENAQQIDPPAKLKYDGLGVFKKDRLVGWLNEEESRGYSLIMNEVKTTIRSVACPEGGDGSLAVEIVQANTKVKGKGTVDRPQIEIEVQADANIAEIACAMDIMNATAISEVERLTESRITESMEMAVHKAQKTYRSDIFDFGGAIHRGDPELWRKLRSDWDTTFENVEVDIHADVKIRRTGTVRNPIQLDLKE